MKESAYNPNNEARSLGFAVKFIDFKKLNSLLTKSVIYLRTSMSRIEARCSLTYEIVHYSRGHLRNGMCLSHSSEEEEIIKQETARKLIHPRKLHELMHDHHSLDEIADELEVTKDILYSYFRYRLTPVLNYSVQNSNVKNKEMCSCP